MAKEKIILIDGDNLVFTLGSISDTSNEVMVIEYPLYKSGGSSSFEQKDLVSKIFDKSSFNVLTQFKIRTVSDLKKLKQPDQPYKLKIGSTVRYNNVSSTIIGFYFNNFAQLNIVSPILFQYSNLVNDVKSLLFGLKENDEITKIINENILSGKYDSELEFPYLASVTNYKKYLSKIVEPPFTTLDSIKVEQEKTTTGGDEIIPFEFPKFQIDFDKSIENSISDYKNYDLDNVASEDTFTDIKANSFNEVYEKSLNYFHSRDIQTNIRYFGKEDLELNLPYNYSKIFEKSDEAKDLLFDTPQGKIPPLVKIITQDYSRRVGKNSLDNVDGEVLFGVLNDGQDKIVMNEVFDFYNILFQNHSTYVGYEVDIKYRGGDGFYDKIPSSPSKTTFSKSLNLLTLKENSYYGDFFNSSGSPSMNSENNNKILPFGSLVKLSGIWWYVIKYFATDINDLENLNKCLCIKATSRDKVLSFKLDLYSLTDKKNRVRVYDTEKIYKASLKNSHIFKFPPNFFSSPQKGKEIIEESKSKDGIVTELFYEKRKEQVDLLKNNFPELSDTFFGILTVLDKKLRKPKDEIKSINTENSIYCALKDSYRNIRYYTNLDKEYQEKILELLEPEKVIKSMLLFNPTKKISKEIMNIALGSSVFRVGNDEVDKLYFSVNNLEEYQKLFVSRTFFNFIQGVAIQKKIVEYEAKIMGESDPRGMLDLNTKNTLSTLSKDYFLSSLQNMNFQFRKREKELNIYHNKSSALNTSFLIDIINKIDYLKFSNYLFVYQVLRNLTNHIQEVALLHLTDNFEEKIKEHPLVKMYKNFDLNTEIGFFKDYHIRTNFPIIQKLEWENMDDKLEKLKKFENANSKLTREMVSFIFQSRWSGELVFESTGIDEESKKKRKELLRNFLTFIKVLDTVYNFELDLINKIKVKNDKFLEEFPITPTDEDLGDEFDDTDIFSEAFEDLGEEFLEEIDNVDITDF